MEETKQQEPQVKVTYKDFMSFDFNQAVQKIVTRPVQAKFTKIIRDWMKHVEKIRTQMNEEYDKVFLPKFAQKDEHGKYIKAENGQGWKSVEGKDEEILAEQEIFGKTEVVTPMEPLNLAYLGDDFKLSAREAMLLGELITHSPLETQQGPGIPTHGVGANGKVQQLRQ